MATLGHNLVRVANHLKRWVWQLASGPSRSQMRQDNSSPEVRGEREVITLERVLEEAMTLVKGLETNEILLVTFCFT